MRKEYKIRKGNKMKRLNKEESFENAIQIKRLVRLKKDVDRRVDDIHIIYLFFSKGVCFTLYVYIGTFEGTFNLPI